MQVFRAVRPRAAVRDVRPTSACASLRTSAHNRKSPWANTRRCLSTTPDFAEFLSRSMPSCETSALQALRKHPVTQVTTLSNGMRVATEAHPGETATVGVWIDTGSRYETQENNGVAHFLEHMVFKGTSKRSQTQLEKEVENMGAHLNAYTSRESTVFYAKVMKGDVAQGMDILADILQNSTLDPAAIRRESDTILREMQEVQTQTEEVIFDHLHETAYQRCSLGRTILGPEENIINMSRDHIKDYVDTHYTGPRMVICGAGAVDHGDLVKLVEKLFANVPTTPKNPVVKEPAVYTGSDIRVRYDDMDLAHVALAFPTVGWADGASVPLMVLQTILGSWDDSNVHGKYAQSSLVSRVADRNLAQSLTAFNTQYSDTGLFGVYAAAEPKAVDELMHAIQDEMTSRCYEVDDTELAIAKNQLITSLNSMMDGSTAVCEEIGRQMLCYGRRMHPVETYERVRDVDAADVKEVAHRFLYDRDPAVAGLGNVYEMPDYNVMRKRTYKWRF